MVMKFGPTAYEAAVAAAIDLDTGRHTRQEVLDRLEQEHGMTSRTATGYLDCYRRLRSVEQYVSTIAGHALRLMLTEIQREGAVQLAIALQSVSAHIRYFESQPTGSFTPEIRGIHRDYTLELAGMGEPLPTIAEFESAVDEALQDGTEARRARLKIACRVPKQVVRVVVEFARNPDVVAEVLHRANGNCEACENPAPFLRRDGRPYLEVHHKVQLAHNGEDCVANSIALCANCHRQSHYGVSKPYSDDV